MSRRGDEVDVPQSDVSIQCKRHCIHELSRIRNKSEQSNTEELFVNSGTLKNNIHNVDENF